MLRREGEEELPSVSDVLKVVAVGVYVSCVALPCGAHVSVLGPPSSIW